jgi:hypothetical protein
MSTAGAGVAGSGTTAQSAGTGAHAFGRRQVRSRGVSNGQLIFVCPRALVRLSGTWRTQTAIWRGDISPRVGRQIS